MSILFLIESPGKIAKIKNFLGKNYLVKASVGHFRDLNPKEMSIDFENNFAPIYMITKPDVVKQMKSAMRGVDTVYIATDSDREGEGIGQHIYDILKPKKYKRLRFNSITKKAIMDAIKDAGELDKNMVDAQKARRVMDRLYGYLISPLVSKQIGGNLSAGRVQSVAAKIVIDKENEIKKFTDKNKDSCFFRVRGVFSELKCVLHETMEKDANKLETPYKGTIAKIPLTEITNKSDPHINVKNFLKKCLKSKFIVHSVSDKIATRSAAPPFTTSTLQQEANRKFGMSVDATMKTAQKLYEAGLITYMRTDSVEISKEGHAAIKEVILQEFGEEFYQQNIYKNKSESAQAAHEAIRPTHPDLLSAEKEVSDPYQIKLYKLIWQRTIASQMKPAKIKVITVQISISAYLDGSLKPYYYFQSQIEKIIFLGFMKVYVESLDDEEKKDNESEGMTTGYKGVIPEEGDELTVEDIRACLEYLRPPPRYSEASLVKQLEKLEIGRPSTFVNTIKTIQDREYIKLDDVAGTKKDIMTYTIKTKNKKIINEIFEDKSVVLLGKEKKKLIPTNLGISVNDFLVENFPEMMDYKFTAKMEAELDAISNGKKIWHKVIKKFYDKLNPIVTELAKKKGIARETDKLLGTDNDGNEIFAAVTKYGPAVKKADGDKFIYAKISDPLTVDTIKLKDAIKLIKEKLEYPKILGKHDGQDVVLNRGKFGFYLVHNGDNYNLNNDTDGSSNDKSAARGQDKSNIKLKDAITIIKKKKSDNIAEYDIKENGKTIKAIILNGQYGPYIVVKRGKTRSNYPIPKIIGIDQLNDEIVAGIISKKKTAKKNQVGSKTAKKNQVGSKTAKKNQTKSKTTKKID